MKKLLEFLKKEGILESTGIVFLFVILCTSVATQLAPLQMSKAEVGRHFASDPNGIRTWVFILIPPFVIAPVCGICRALWKAKWPTKTN